MKKLLSVIIFIFFSFSSILAQESQQTQDEQNLSQPSETELKESTSIQPPTPTVPSTIKNKTKKKRNLFSLGLEFGYDFLSEYKALKFIDEGKSFDCEMRKAKYRYWDLLFTFSFSSGLRYSFGIEYIFSGFDNTLPVTVGSESFEIRQYLGFSFALKVAQLEYDIDLDYISLVPYAGISFAIYTSKFAAILPEFEFLYPSIAMPSFVIPVYAGMNIIIARHRLFSLFAGAEIGYLKSLISKEEFPVRDADLIFLPSGVSGNVKAGIYINF